MNCDFRKDLIVIRANRKILALFIAICIATMQLAMVASANVNTEEAADVAGMIYGAEEESSGIESFLEARENIYEPHTIPDDWTIGYEHPNRIDKEENYMQASSAYSYSGNNSLEIAYPMGDLGDGTQIYFRNYGVSGLEPADYEMSFYIMEPSRTKLCIKLESVGKTVSKELKWPIGNTRTDAGDGWWKYTITFREADINDHIVQVYLCQFDAIPTPVYLDNVSFTKVGETENFILNGDFEEVYIPSEIDKYEPTNVMVSVRNKVILAPSWVNPQTDADEIRLYDITDGKNQLLSKSFATGAGKINTYKYENLTPDKTYLFRIEFDFGEKGVKEFYTHGSTSNSQQPIQAGGWAPFFGYGVEHGYMPIWTGLDTNEKHSGNGSLRLKSNINGENGLIFEFNIAFGNKFTENKRYLLSYWAKGKKVAPGAMTLKMENSNIFTQNTINDDWTQYTAIYDTTPTATYTPSLSGCLKFWVTKSIGDLWIDDIEVYEVDANLNVISENLVSDPEIAGFEKGVDAAVPPIIKQLNVKAESRKATLSWAAPVSSLVDCINVYEVINGEYALRAVLPSNQSELQLSNLVNETEYTYAVKTISKSNIESDPVLISVVPVTPETEILELKLNGGTGKFVAGTNTFDIEVLNNFSANPFDVELIVGVFKNDGKELVELVTSPTTLYAGENSPLSASFTVPSLDGGYSVKAFIWNKLFGLDSLRSVSEFTVE